MMEPDTTENTAMSYGGIPIRLERNAAPSDIAESLKDYIDALCDLKGNAPQDYYISSRLSYALLEPAQMLAHAMCLSLKNKREAQ